jgi:hypothetical protein
MQREQHEAETDEHSAEIVRLGGRIPTNKRTPIKIRAGEIEVTSNEKTSTMRVVPTFAPSMTARAGVRSTNPPAAKPTSIKPVAVLL